MILVLLYYSLYHVCFLLYNSSRWCDRKSTRSGRRQVILCSHAGRPKGEVVESMRIYNIGGCLGELLDEPVACPDDCIGEKVQEQVRIASTRLLLEACGLLSFLVWCHGVSSHLE